MILLMFVLGIVLALGIARYNKSNKLFWTLVLAMTLGYASTVMIQRMNHCSDNKDCFKQTSSTQALAITSDAFMGLLGDVYSPTSSLKVTDSDPVSQTNMFVDNKTIFIASMIFGGIRDQPINNIMFDTS